MSAKPLDLLNIPLSNLGLIEASAGTGKTFSITWLYLRLLLESELPVERILVVTFTDAAADELRERIRQLINWTRSFLVNTLVLDSKKENEVNQLQALLSRCAENGRDNKALFNLLTLAMESFDQAAIFTIHGWCRRIAADYALTTLNQAGKIEVDNDSSLKLKIVEDLWRQELHRGANNAEWLLQIFSTPEYLYKETKSFFYFPVEIFLPQNPEIELEVVHKKRFFATQDVIQLWNNSSHKTLLTLLINEKNGLSHDKDKGYHCEKVKTALLSLKEWIDNKSLNSPLPQELKIFTSDFFYKSQLESAKKKNLPFPEHPLLDALLKLADIEAETLRLERARLLKFTLSQTQIELRRYEERDEKVSFDSLIGLVHEALTATTNNTFATQLRQQYPIALVDEFQDTDQRQFAIFQVLYAQQSTLLMIGDVKQSIYRFRGGDVFVYGKARNLAEPNWYTLDANYRSEPALTSVINKLFCGEKKFICNFIKWNDVQGRGPKNGTMLQPNVAPLIIWHAQLSNDKSKNKNPVIPVNKLEPVVAKAVANEIVHLLQEGKRGHLNLGNKAVAAGDIAVLVNKHDQAILVEQALRECKVPCTRLSRQSVYECVEAKEMLIILHSLLAPTKNSRLCAALATEIIGWNAQQISQLSENIELKNKEFERFSKFARVWHEHGPLALIESLLRENSSQLLGFPDGERRVANWRHLAELLNPFFVAGHSHCDQLAIFERNITNADGDNELEQLRVDTDANCVQVITIHASKGLEYPIVFAPFLWQGSRKTAKHPPVLCHTENFSPYIDLGSSNFSKHADIAEYEEYAEAMRITYVACTRAINRLYLVWGKINGAEKSPMARLLHGNPMPDSLVHNHYLQMDNELIAEELEKLSRNTIGAINVRPLPSSVGNWQPDLRMEKLTSQKFTGNVSETQSVHSFTRFLQRDLELEQTDQYELENITQTDPLFDADEDNMPRGPQLGECFHAILEEIDFKTLDSNHSLTVISKAVERHGFDKEVESVIMEWIHATVNSELLPGLRLAYLCKNKRISEMEFHFALYSESPHELHNLAQRFPDYADALSILTSSSSSLEGWMHGYIDLVVEHAGRYFVVDYKSNYLGNEEDAYAADRLATTISRHRYDAQALIYEVALHRYLTQRLNDRYNAEKMLGGALYVFVRGIDVAIPGSGIHFMQPPVALILALDRWLGSALTD